MFTVLALMDEFITNLFFIYKFHFSSSGLEIYRIFRCIKNIWWLDVMAKWFSTAQAETYTRMVKNMHARTFIEHQKMV